MTSGPRSAVLVAVIIWLLAARAYAHEVLHTVERGRAIALKAFFADGEALAYVEYEVYSPADPRIPYQKGRTDRGGYLAFVPDKSGRWRVKVADASGHGLDLEIPVTTDKGQAAATSRQDEALFTAAFVLRPMIGLAIIAAIFSALTLIYRLRGKTK